MKIKIFILCCTFFTSCATAKWKDKYMNKHVGLLYEKYAVKKNIQIKVSPFDFVDKPNKKLTRKDVKKNVNGWERIIANMPDSTYESAKGIDSFYSNKNKIEFIKSHNLKTPNIYFIEK